MILILAYFHIDNYDIFFETEEDINWDNEDVKGFYNSDIYFQYINEMKRMIFEAYNYDDYSDEKFNEFFEYSTWVIPR